MFTWKLWHYYGVKHILIKPNSDDVLAQSYKHGGVITFKIFFRGEETIEERLALDQVWFKMLQIIIINS